MKESQSSCWSAVRFKGGNRAWISHCKLQCCVMRSTTTEPRVSPCYLLVTVADLLMESDFMLTYSACVAGAGESKCYRGAIAAIVG